MHTLHYPVCVGAPAGRGGASVRVCLGRSRQPGPRQGRWYAGTMHVDTQKSAKGMRPRRPGEPGPRAPAAVRPRRLRSRRRSELRSPSRSGFSAPISAGRVNGRVWTGTDGLFLTDQMQYMAWIQSASHQLLVSDLFVVHGSPADYFQPLVVISAVLARAGIAAWLMLLLWQPVSVLAIFFAARAFVRATLPAGTNGASRWRSRCSGRPARYRRSMAGILDVGLRVSADRDRGAPRRAGPLRACEDPDRASVWPAALLGALGSWCHPWQGETLILISRDGVRPVAAGRTLRPLGADADGRRHRDATLLPLLYLVALRISTSVGPRTRREQALYSAVHAARGARPAAVRQRTAYRRRPSDSSRRDPDVAARGGNRLRRLRVGHQRDPAARVRGNHDSARRCSASRVPCRWPVACCARGAGWSGYWWPSSRCRRPSRSSARPCAMSRRPSATGTSSPPGPRRVEVPRT